jgi:molybdopterin synthase catalytic subunit/molybdopterin synthase sulfur carrier subunit
MIVRVLIFGPLSQEMAAREVGVEVGEHATIGAVNQALAAKFPDRASFFRSARLAVNGAFAGPSQIVRPNDEVALIEMVSGG